MLSAVSFGVLSGPLKDYLEEFAFSIRLRKHLRRLKIAIFGIILPVTGNIEFQQRLESATRQASNKIQRKWKVRREESNVDEYLEKLTLK